jgi:hypothetical protein
MHSIEVTDTFSGEANYSWVRRGTTERNARRGLIDAAKELAGWRCRVRVEDVGDMLTIRPVSTAGLCQVAFVMWIDDVEVQHGSQ